MMMQMLESGGMPIVSDDLRQADESNPQGYYELKRVKELDKGGDTSWQGRARKCRQDHRLPAAVPAARLQL